MLKAATQQNPRKKNQINSSVQGTRKRDQKKNAKVDQKLNKVAKD